MMNVQLLPAAHGDCIWIEYGTPKRPRYVLIDGGPKPTWEGGLKDHLAGYGTIELLVLTHIDADHIAGAIPMLEEIDESTFKDVWFNGWKHLQPGQFLSAKQGEVFSTLLNDRSDPWNKAFAGRAVCAREDDLPTVTLTGGLKLTILSPTPKELSRLRPKWSKQLVKHGLTPGAHSQYRQFLARTPNPSTDVEELAATAFRSDSSAPNASSIAFLAEYGTKSVLFTGDAYASVLHRTISKLITQRRVERLVVDALKVPHHGSRGNVNLRLLSLLDCKQFWFSSNGAIHKLPDNEAIGRILHSAEREPKLVFNYHCKRTEAWSSKGLQDRYHYTVDYGTEGHSIIEL